MMGGGGNMPATQPNPLGIQDNRGATNQQAVPVPYILGRQRIAVTWMSDPFDIKTTAVQAQSGKSSQTISGYNYRASIAALVCGGPVDQLLAVYMNGDLVWGVAGPYVTVSAQRGVSHPDFYDFTIPNYGPVRFYWGTETQVVDPYLSQHNKTVIDASTITESNPTGNTIQIEHTAYRGAAYMVFNGLSLGFNQTNFQNIEVVVARYPQPSWGRNPANLVGDCHPISVYADALQNTRQGLALTDDWLNTATLNETADELTAEKFGISPIITSETPATDLFVQLAEYIDGFTDVDEDGKFLVGLYRPSDEPLTITMSQMADRPEITPNDWSSTYNEIRVTFNNSLIDLDKDYVPWRNPANRSINNTVPQPLTLERWWITRVKLVNSVAAAAGRTNGLPAITGKLSLRVTGTNFSDLVPGAAFTFPDYTDRAVGGLIFRVLTRTADDSSKPEFSITFIADRSYLYPAPAKGGDDGDADPDSIGQPLVGSDPVPVSGILRVVELPLALCPEGKLSLAVLMARTDQTLIGFGVNLSKNYGGSDDSYALLAQQRGFALHGALLADFSAGVEMVSRDQGLSVQLDGVDLSLEEQTFYDALANKLLVFVGDEIFSVRDWSLLDSGKFTLYCVRARFATPRQDHSAGDEVFIANLTDLVALQHPAFQPGNTPRFKIAPTAQQSADLADVAPLDVAIAGKVYTQTPPINLKVNGARSSASFNAGSDIEIDWSLTEAGRDLYHAELLQNSTVLDFLAGDGSVLGSTEVSAGVSTKSLTNAALVALLGGVEASFTLRAKTKIAGYEFILFSASIQLAVTKI